jgi:hypothetical protein
VQAGELPRKNEEGIMTTPILPPPTIQISDEDLTASFAHALKQRSTAAREWQAQAEQFKAVADQQRASAAHLASKLAEVDTARLAAEQANAHAEWRVADLLAERKMLCDVLSAETATGQTLVEALRDIISERDEARAALAERTGAAPGLAQTQAHAAMGEE